MRAEQPAVGFISLGCPKALVDSERILTQINADGYAITDRYDDAAKRIAGRASAIKLALYLRIDAGYAVGFHHVDDFFYVLRLLQSPSNQAFAAI